MRIDHRSWWGGCGRTVAASVGIAAAVAAGAPAAAEARGAIAPQNSAAPTVIGAPRENNTLTAGNGTWTNAPTTFTYQWQLCGAGRLGLRRHRGGDDEGVRRQVGRRRPHASRRRHRRQRRRPGDRRLRDDERRLRGEGADVDRTAGDRRHAERSARR